MFKAPPKSNASNSYRHNNHNISFTRRHTNTLLHTSAIQKFKQYIAEVQKAMKTACITLSLPTTAPKATIEEVAAYIAAIIE